jgi:hypothetical protein
LRAAHSHTSHAPAEPIPSVEDQERAKVRAIIAEVLASTGLSRDGSASKDRKAPYVPVVIAAPPPLREKSSHLRPAPSTSALPPPPSYRPSPGTPPKTRPLRPSDVASIDRQQPAHFRSYSAATSAAGVAQTAEQAPFDDSLFRPAPLAAQRAGPNHGRSFSTGGVDDPRSRQRLAVPSATSEATPQPFKHNPPSFDLKSPILAPQAPPRPRPQRQDTFASVPGHQEARNSKYPAFTVPGHSERERVAEQRRAGGGDVYPRMRRYNEELDYFEGAERGPMTLPQ